ncbi:MAG: hypothetical protein CBC47_06465 [Alphaproteobacteria bacterium TMED87]|nr:MAG: hypothetical protein CBC47_06465 [Alphaproteobacteria bacterium TMED87]
MKDIAIYRLKRVENALGRLDSAVARLNKAVSTAKSSSEDFDDLERNELDGQHVLDKYNKLKEVSSKAITRIEKIIKHLEISNNNIN